MRETARGHADDTPVRALTGVTMTIGAVVVVLVVAISIIWLALK
jgi:hypothetical protein